MKVYKQTWHCPECSCDMVIKSPSGMTIQINEYCPECGSEMVFLSDQSELKS